MSRRPRWRRWRRVLLPLLLCAVAALLYHYARGVAWHEVGRALRGIPAQAAAWALAATLGGYLAYAGLDLLGRHYLGHRLPAWQVAGIAMMSYALNLNLGVLVGGLGARLRLYGRLGCRKSLPTRVALFSAVSNWLGFGWLAGLLLLAGVVPPPLPGGAGRLLGLGLAAASAAYTWACWRSPGRSWTLRGWRVVLPSLPVALAQAGIAAASWASMGLALYLLLQARVPYALVLGVMLCASFAALIVRIPGGLGTTEALFVAALAGRLPGSEVLAAVLAYRAIYFFIPLALALPGFGLLEAARAWRRTRPRRG
ncbi:lysylphosphatidylglycerol synthase domain-containing protein [Bordetella hinzii]|uniref:lysylphosphatidylglycerol synthase domain-containing protein n=1 Tax=Bordetella hinzii TaxID=103855 RepID=UPI002A18AF05|nr:lysylphosphatidylglycerol synthase domain-containing protein [Bordetella hinzii]WPL80742.1 lysylphosphatidylglycerol synthase domain-containing protein [Bordetella hinzii]